MDEQEKQTRIVRQLRSGQITIPAPFRRKLGIEEDTVLQITLADGELKIRPMQAPVTAAGSSWFRELYDNFAPIREEVSDKGYSEGEINATIDGAVSSARRKRA